MGAGDLNVKKSWHPRLQKNQEKVWLQEQEAEAERKKLEELRKEREQERQMQELQRIHEAAGGKRRPERVEWMYATPATSSGPSEAELEDYLLGKKRVDKLLQGNEAQQLMRDAVPAAQPDPDEARASRDMAVKIREDPLFAIKKQEQAMREMLMKDPTRLRQMRARMGLPTPRDEHSYSHRRSSSPRGLDSRDRSRRHDRYEDDRRHRHSHDDRKARHRHDDRYDRHRDYDRRNSHRHETDPRDRDHYRRRYDGEARRSYHDHADDRRRSHSRHNEADYRATSRRPSRSPERRTMSEAERESKLAEMKQNAQQMTQERNAMLGRVESEERQVQEQEALERNKTHERAQWKQEGAPGRAAFLLDQQRNLWGKQSGGMDLHEHLRRSRHALEAVSDDTL